MNVACMACPAKYSVPDEKVRGKKVRITCKHCGTAIVVDGSALGPGSAQKDALTSLGPVLLESRLVAPEPAPAPAAAPVAAMPVASEAKLDTSAVDSLFGSAPAPQAKPALAATPKPAVAAASPAAQRAEPPRAAAQPKVAAARRAAPARGAI